MSGTTPKANNDTSQYDEKNENL